VSGDRAQPAKESNNTVNDSTVEAPARRQGTLFIVSAPSGAGKTTLCRAALSHFSDIYYSVSHTTRPPRGEERDGIDYFFIPKAEFLQGIAAGRWVEWAEVHDNFYGTSRELLEKHLAEGRDVLLDIDVQGMTQIVGQYPESVTIFIMPPSLEALRTRMESRGADTAPVIEKRLKNAEKEIGARDRYQHVIVNDRLPEAIEALIALISACRARTQGLES
jgi:guanylate kinase